MVPPVLLIIVLVNQVDHYFHHDILFLRTALGYHQCKSHKGVVGNAFAPIRIIKNAIAGHKPQKEGGRNAFVCVCFHR